MGVDSRRIRVTQLFPSAMEQVMQAYPVYSNAGLTVSHGVVEPDMDSHELRRALDPGLCSQLVRGIVVSCVPAISWG